VVVRENGELCRCGKRGCLETVASARAVVKQMKMNSLGEVVSSFTAGNPVATATIENAGHYLGASLANLTATLNIQKIVLTGDMTRFGEKWLNAVSESMQAGVFSRMTERTTLEIGRLDYRACILGASAFLLLDDYSLLFNEEN
jgi:glucokinase